MCESGICADHYALFAVVQTYISQKSIQLKATTLADAESELKDKHDSTLVLLYIESRHVANS